MLLLIDRYIAKLFGGFFLAALVVFVTLYVAIDFMSNISHYQAPGQAVANYYLYSSLGIAYQIMPVACLLATIFTLSSLGRANELVALFSSGMSLARISAPILLFVVAASCTGFWLTDRLGPVINQKKNYVYFVEIAKQPGLYSTVKSNKIWFKSGNVLFNIKALQGEKAQAQGLTMYYFDASWKLIQLITADDVALKGENWELRNGTVTLFPKELNAPMTQSFKAKTIVMSEDAADLQSTARTTDMMGVAELGRFISRNKEAGLDTLRYEVDYHSKFGFAFAAFVMSFIGIPFSVARQRTGGTALNAGVCVFLAFAYWTFYSSGLTLGYHGLLPPIAAAWAPNLIMVALSTFLLLRMKK
jgi:lipopolysaccharide export system permease protein